MKNQTLKQTIQTYQRNHSFSKTPSLAQLTSYVIFISEALVFYIYVINQYQSLNLKIIMSILFTISFLGLVIAAVWTGQKDPTDDLVIGSKMKDLKKIMEYRESGKKVFYCSLCQSAVKEKTRHCLRCGSCSQNFDHHCIWLNTCIGSKNYKVFFVTICLAFFNFFFFLLAISFLTAQMKIGDGNMNSVGFILMWITGLVVVVFEFLIASLISLHIYLIYKGLTTYRFIMIRAQQKKKEQEEQIERQKQKERKQKARIAQEQKSSTTIIHEVKKEGSKIKSIDESLAEDKNSKEQEGKSIKVIEISRTSQKSSIKENDQTLSLEKKISSNYPTEVRFTQIKNDLVSSRIQSEESRRSKIISSERESEKSEKLSIVNERTENIELDQKTSKKYFIGKESSRNRLSKFFTKNASFDVLFAGKHRYFAPHQDLKKMIELDEEIRQYKKHQSMVVTQRFEQKAEQTKDKQILGIFNKSPNKLAIRDSFNKNIDADTIFNKDDSLFKERKPRKNITTPEIQKIEAISQMKANQTKNSDTKMS